MGSMVTWEMQLATLRYYREAAHDISGFLCPFIEIADSGGQVYPLRVGLDLDIIDEPAIRKTIIMIRNYKRLAIGRLEFCRDE